jgi:type II secretory pathway component PulK
MRSLNNNKGMALLTVLMMTAIMLTMIVGILTLVSDNSQRSASQKTYQNVIEASYGGADIAAQDVIPRLFTNISTSVIKADYSLLGMQFGSSACLRQKMKKPVSGWTACTNSSNVNPKINSDLTFNLSGQSGSSNTSFKVYAKIVDTAPGVDYPEQPSGGPLLGGGVVESSGPSTLYLQHYVYRIEVAGEGSINPAEKSNLSVLYEY